MVTTVINFFPGKDRRKHNRRIADLDSGDLYKTFSTDNCHSCIERGGESILLINEGRKLLYATVRMQSFLDRYPELLILEPQLSLSDKLSNRLLQDYFRNEENSHPLLMPILSHKDNVTFKIFFTCSRLPKPSILRPNIAQFLIKVRGETRYSDQDWYFFARQFSLTQAEIKLCRAIADGWTLQRAAAASNISINTIRTQISSIFSKTYTQRQSDLLRLIHLTIQS